MNKKVTIAPKPQSGRQAATADPDEWVRTGRIEEREAMKRLTIDVPASLHTRIKVQCAERGVKIADEVRALLEQHFGNA